MKGSLLSFVWSYSRGTQIVLLVLTLATFPFVYASLEIPKIIINEAINGTGFPRDVLGWQVGQIPFLLLLCGLFLALVLIINALKWLLNVGIGMAGERLLRRMRFQLVEYVLRYPMRRFRSLRSGETIQSIMGELEPLGGFFGEVLVTPIFQGGMLAVYVAFIFVQDFWLGLAAVSLYPVQLYVIPVLQAKVIRLNRERAANSRVIAEEIGGNIQNVADIRGNATTSWHLSQVSDRLYQNTLIRQSIFRRKFTIKFVNNLLNQLTPFFFYAVGGYLVITGDLDFGALVAVLAAYKDLAGPWKALLAYIQRLADFGGRYRYVVEGFLEDDLIAPERLYGRDGPPPEGDLVAENVVTRDGADGVRIPRLALRPGEMVAIAGETGARETVLRTLAGLEPPARGAVRVGGTELGSMPLGRASATVALVADKPILIGGTIRENAFYGIFGGSPQLSDNHDPDAETRLREAQRTGGPLTDPAGSWLDLDQAGAADMGELDARLLRLVEAFGLADDLNAAALDRTLPADRVAQWAAPILSLRASMAERREEFADLIEPWAPDGFNTNGTLLENLTFALPVEFRPVEEQLADPAMREILDRSGGGDILAEAGWRIASEIAALAGALDAASPIFSRFAVFGRREIVEASRVVAAAGAKREALLRRERPRLQALGAKFIPTRDQLDIVDGKMQARILEARTRALPMVRASDRFTPLDAEGYNPARTVAENVINARRRFDRRPAWSRLNDAIRDAIHAEGLWSDLVSIGLDARLPETQLPAGAIRRLGLVRAVLKRPRFLLLQGLAEADTPADAELRAKIRAELPGAGILYTATSGETAHTADRIIAIDASGECRDQ